MADNEAKAQKTLAEADKKSKGVSGLLGGMFGGGNKTEEACDLYIKAANLFKIAKNWNEAGKAFSRAAELQLGRGEAKHLAASNYTDAANCFRKCNAQHAVDCFNKAAEIYTDMARGGCSADCACEGGAAGALHDGRQAPHVHRRAVRERLRRRGPGHGALREGRRLLQGRGVQKDLMLALEEQNIDQFTETVKEFDKVSRLDPWCTMMLVRVKRQCGEAEDDLK